jgi:large subunit ribosomal protein L5e
MPFVKVVKNKAYFKRFQVKYRRRREGKTDYYARKRLITQDKNKYNTHKYRLVVRITNSDVIAQIVYATIDHDVVLSAAYSHELPRYGIPLGLTNYAAAYATGLLIARRVLTKLNLADKYVGVKDPNGEFYLVEDNADGPRPFNVLLDVGLARTSTGARVFAVLKGAVDGGLKVPHKTKRFPGYDAESDKFDAATLRKYILGGHVADYMRSLKEEDEERYKKQFARFIAAGIDADKVEAMYKKAHASIRASPAYQSTKKAYPKDKKPKAYNHKKLTHDQRKQNIKAKLAAAEKAAHDE